MYPPGHVALSYLLARPLTRNQPTVAEFACLTVGTLSPAAINVLLGYINFLDLNDKWSHSPLMLASLLLVAGVVYKLHFPFRVVLLMFVLGVASHLVGDFLFDFPLLYFSDRIDSVGGWWLFPFRRVTLTGPQLEPGFQIQPWELILEGVFLLGTLKLWARKDLWLYSLGTVTVTLLWVGYVPGFV